MKVEAFAWLKQGELGVGTREWIWGGFVLRETEDALPSRQGGLGGLNKGGIIGGRAALPRICLAVAIRTVLVRW